MKNVTLSRPSGRRWFAVRLGIVLTVLVTGAYLTISMFSSSSASESTLDEDIQSDLSLVHAEQSILGPQGGGSASGRESAVQSYASPAEINDVVPLVDQQSQPFDQTKTLEYVKHSVQPGENLWSIARKYGRSIHALVSANQSVLSDQSYLPKGLTLRIPNRDGILTTLKSGQTLWDLMKSYNVDYRNIVRFNGLSSASAVTTGQELFIPGAQPLNTFQFKPGNTVNDGFSWPVSPGKRRVTSDFGKRLHPKLRELRPHHGIDIGASRGTAVFSSRPGEVAYSQRYGDYGKTVVVRHSNGYSTWYAHLSRIVVQEGQFVERGQPIAFMGSSGLTTGVNLHFEIKRNGEILDPNKYLPDP